MAQNIIILLTEGDHDAAFLYRILKANGFTKYSKKIKEFDSPLKELLATDILNVSIPEVNIQNARTRFLPNNVVTEGENILLIYAIQGDSRGDIRTKLIDAFNNFNTKNPQQIQVSKDTTVSVLYFLDADSKGIDARLIEINNELTVAFAGIEFEKFTANASLKIVDDILIGAYIFVKAGEQTGKLEDILLPMMEAGNEDIFKVANNFLSIHESSNLYKDEVELNEDKSIKKVFGDKYHPKKSLIGTIGQLHKSGKSNTVCISDANYLNDEKLKASEVCKDIVLFIRKVMKENLSE
jgi:hypothetical protein